MVKQAIFCSVVYTYNVMCRYVLKGIHARTCSLDLEHCSVFTIIILLYGPSTL